MTKLNQADNDLLKRIVDLELRFKQDEGIIKGYRTTITRLNEDIRAHEYVDLTLERAQRTILKLESELGR